MLQFEGERQFDMAPAALWPKLRDAGFLARCVPGGTLVGEPTRERAALVVQPGVAFVRGTLDAVLHVVDAVEPNSIRASLVSKGVGSGSTIVADLALAADGDGTSIRWTADVTELTGLLKAAPPGLIRGAALQIIDGLWDGIAARLGEAT